jgi:hypothetical protein
MNMLHVVLAALVLTWSGFQLFAPPLHPVKPLRNRAIQTVNLLSAGAAYLLDQGLTLIPGLDHPANQVYAGDYKAYVSV